MEKTIKDVKNQESTLDEAVEEVVTEVKAEAVEVVDVAEEVVEVKAEKAEEADTKEVKEETAGESFEQLLEDSLINIQTLDVGDKVEGEIINITDSLIFVSLGGKRDAYAEKVDFSEKNEELKYKVGDKLKGFVVKSTDTEILISKSLVSVNKRLLKEAFEEKIPVNGKVRSLIKGGYLLDLSGVRAFCPTSQIDTKLVKDPKAFINQSYDFMIIEYKENGRNIVASRRALLDVAKNKIKAETMKTIKVGVDVKGKVTRLTNFGAFVDIGGVEGLLHISQFSWARVESPSDMLSIGDEIEARVITLKGEKISLSMKALQENPFDLALQEIKEGDIVNCRILRNQAFGSFVEIKPGVEGLIPISEMARGRRINNPSEVVAIGDLVEAQILRVNLEKKKISLSLKALQPEPWDTIGDTFAENDIVNGKIENLATFGAFISLSAGITGLLPNSKIKLAGLKLDKANIGEDMKVRIVKIDVDKKRVSLEPTNMPETAYDDKEDWNKYRKQKVEIIDEDNPFAKL
jgi:small subunit ribosomal protein S1